MIKNVGNILRTLQEEQEEPSGAINALSYVGNMFCLIYFVTPLIQVIRAYKTTTFLISDIPILLLIFIILNCLLWLINAFASDDLGGWIPLLISNGAGILINVCLLYLYLNLFLKKNLKLFLFYGIFTLDIIAQISYFMFRFIILNDKDNKGKEQAEKEFHMIGFVATVINIMMYSSSFVDVVKMTKTKKPENMPIFTIGCGLLCTIIFMVQGVVQYNHYNSNEQKMYAIETMISNGISFLSLAIQGGIWLFYFITRPKDIHIDDEKLDKLNASDTNNSGA